MKKYTLIILALLLLPESSAVGQENELAAAVPVRLSDAVGDTIDASEANRYGLFTDVENFVSAVYFRMPNGGYAVKITKFNQNGVEVNEVQKVLQVGFDFLRNRLSNPLSLGQSNLFEQLQTYQKSGQWTMITTSAGEKIECQISSVKGSDTVLITYSDGTQRYLSLNQVVNATPLSSQPQISPRSFMPMSENQRKEHPVVGAKEVAGEFSLVKTQGTTNLSITPSFGYFATRYIELEVGFAASFIGDDADNSFTVMQGGALIVLNAVGENSTVGPFVQFGGGFLNASADVGGTSTSKTHAAMFLGAGIRTFPTKDQRVGFSFGYGYTRYSSIGVHSLGTQLSYFFLR